MEKSDFNHILYVRDIFCQVFPFYRTAITHKNIFVFFFTLDWCCCCCCYHKHTHIGKVRSVSFPRNCIFTSSICVFLCCSWHIYIFSFSITIAARSHTHSTYKCLFTKQNCMLEFHIYTRIHFRRFVSTLTILVWLTVCCFLLIGISHIFIIASVLDFVYIFAFSKLTQFVRRFT